uniref:G-protein coupled receptors family 1 profile domain-containing protein n=1 Tax=Brugia malayi TaxID=6279 RepID=A0A7I4KHH2_BRUMA
MESNDEQLPFCSICLSSSDSRYIKYNMVVSGIILPIIGLIGIVGNVLVMVVYGSIEQRRYSTNIYLAALALSDFCMICTAIILYGLEAWRHHGPTGKRFQLWQLFTVKAQNLFSRSVLSYKLLPFIFVLLQRLIFLFELFYQHKLKIKFVRQDDSDTISLILVVFMFIFCNSAALLVNFIEMVFAEKAYHLLVYLVDMSNLLVVINCTGNFFCYLFFGASFRRTLRKILIGRSNQFYLDSFTGYHQ